MVDRWAAFQVCRFHADHWSRITDDLLVLGLIAQPASDKADIVIDAHGVALRPASGRIAGRVPGQNIGLLRTRTVNIHPRSVHIAHRPAERNVGAGWIRAAVEEYCARPEVWEIGLTGFVRDDGAREEVGVNCGGTMG